jgi:hypothetical protein
MLMEMQLRVTKNTKVFNTIYMQNAGVLKYVVKKNYMKKNGDSDGNNNANVSKHYICLRLYEDVKFFVSAACFDTAEA